VAINYGLSSTDELDDFDSIAVIQDGGCPFLSPDYSAVQLDGDPVLRDSQEFEKFLDIRDR
jgi:hypothetical protein